MTWKLGTRKSKLALWQSELVKSQLAELGQECELVEILSEGDKVLDTPLPLMGGKGVFTKALDDALLSGAIDFAVHSLKDVPTRLPEGIQMAAILKRASWEDVLVVRKDLKFMEEDREMVIATSSLRRQTQWKSRYPNTKVVDIRGNVQTRIAKLRASNWDGAIFAAAGLERMDLDHEIAMRLDWMLPAPGQGAIAIVCRENDTEILSKLQKLHHPETANNVLSERQYLHVLNGGCSAPIGARARVENGKTILSTVLIDVETGKEIRHEIEADFSPNELHLGKEAASLSLKEGAQAIIDKLTSKR
ncbi:MAG: hydroxymethylbilane synthase [Flavobacteriales bacterium]|jgi:hydroxymethylbilane synthase|nr:hydroxymethylbilane synthase [Flavobacteriales bacterium]